MSERVVSNLEEIKLAKQVLDSEFDSIRADMQKVQNEIKQEHLEQIANLKQADVNTLVQNMNDYENQLISLITSLKTKGVSNQNILNALITKGHPRMYATMILNNLDQIYLK